MRQQQRANIRAYLNKNKKFQRTIHLMNIGKAAAEGYQKSLPKFSTKLTEVPESISALGRLPHTAAVRFAAEDGPEARLQAEHGRRKDGR